MDIYTAIITYNMKGLIILIFVFEICKKEYIRIVSNLNLINSLEPSGRFSCRFKQCYSYESTSFM